MAKRSCQIKRLTILFLICSINFSAQKLSTVAPQIIPFDFGDEPANTGDTVGVQCLANKGDLPMEIRWILNSSPIVSNELGISIVKLNQRTSSLSIGSVEAMHRGSLKCLVSNKAGVAEHSIELKVNGLSMLFISASKIEISSLRFVFFEYRICCNLSPVLVL